LLVSALPLAGFVNGLGGVFSRFFSVFAAMRSVSSALRSSSDLRPVLRASFGVRDMPKDSPLELPFYSCAVDRTDIPESVYAAIGETAMAWARLEQHLDAVLFQVNKPQHSATLYKEHPVSFTRKLDLLKAWFNKHPALAAHKEHMKLLRTSLKQISKEFRNPLLHSIFANYDPASKTITFKGMQSVGADQFRMSTSTLELDRLKRAPLTLNQANEILSWISQDLFSEDAVARLEKP